jgi:hypothetical protein
MATAELLYVAVCPQEWLLVQTRHCVLIAAFTLSGLTGRLTCLESAAAASTMWRSNLAWHVAKQLPSAFSATIRPLTIQDL